MAAKRCQCQGPWKESEPVKVLKAHPESHEIEELIQQQRCNSWWREQNFQRLKKNGEVLKGQYRYKAPHQPQTIYVGDWNSDKSYSVPTIGGFRTKKSQVQDIQDNTRLAPVVSSQRNGQKWCLSCRRPRFCAG